MKDVLIVFARFPEQGQCKTRLIPCLGEVGATELHRQMTQRTLRLVREFARQSNVRIEVHFTGGDATQMSDSFGDDLLYVPQSNGDLGDRLATAFRRLLDAETQRIVVIGTDCPQLTVGILQAAFVRLATHQVCISPATDGGYTLLGIASPEKASLRMGLCEQLFQQIEWGTERVLERTLSRIREAGQSCSLLPTLADVDTPQDLPIWAAAIEPSPRPQPLISVVIPTLNNEPRLSQAVESANTDPRVEVIVVAAGDTSTAMQVAIEKRVQLLPSVPGRSLQMNAGAKQATADTLLFLHADTVLPDGYEDAILELLDDKRVVGGAFQLQIDSSRWPARVIEKGVMLRTSLCHLPYGDQAIFVRKTAYEKLGGFPEVPIMEDYVFVRRLRQLGKIAMMTQSVTTSARRWEKLGFLRTTFINQCMLLGFRLGVPIESLARYYKQHKPIV